MLRHAGGQRGKKLLDAIRAGTGAGIEIVCAELKRDVEKQEFVAAEFRAAGRSVHPRALRALVAAFSGDLSDLSSACRQLIADAPGDIDEAVVTRYYAGRVDMNAFEVADTAIAGRHGEALIALRHALDSGADPVPIVAAFAMKVRTMAKVSGVRGGGPKVAASLGLAPWQVDRARRDLAGGTTRGSGGPSRRWPKPTRRSRVPSATPCSPSSASSESSPLAAATSADDPGPLRVSAESRSAARVPSLRRSRSRTGFHRSVTGDRPGRDAALDAERGTQNAPHESCRAFESVRRVEAPAACFAIADLRFAAWFLWMTPLEAALSSLRVASRSAVVALSVSPVSAASRNLRTADLRLALDGLVALVRLLVLPVALDLGLDVCHVVRLSFGVGTGCAPRR